MDKLIQLPYIPAIGTSLVLENSEPVKITDMSLVISTGLTNIRAEANTVWKMFDLAADHDYRLVNDLLPRGKNSETDELVYAEWNWWVGVREQQNTKIPENLRLIMEKTE